MSRKMMSRPVAGIVSLPSKDMLSVNFFSGIYMNLGAMALIKITPRLYIGIANLQSKDIPMGNIS